MRGQRDLFRRALLTGLVLATATTVVPWLKYPPNPPAVGDPDTIDQRQLLYSLVIVLTGVVLLVMLTAHRRMREQAVPEAQRWIIAAALFVVPMALVLTLLPPNDDPITVPASLIWQFRVVSLAGNLLRWGLLSVAFGVLATQREVTHDHDREVAAVS
jgi:predicted cobalt transporter CbtA